MEGKSDTEISNMVMVLQKTKNQMKKIRLCIVFTMAAELQDTWLSLILHRVLTEFVEEQLQKKTVNNSGHNLGHMKQQNEGKYRKIPCNL